MALMLPHYFQILISMIGYLKSNLSWFRGAKLFPQGKGVCVIKKLLDKPFQCKQYTGQYIILTPLLTSTAM